MHTVSSYFGRELWQAKHAGGSAQRSILPVSSPAPSSSHPLQFPHQLLRYHKSSVWKSKDKHEKIHISPKGLDDLPTYLGPPCWILKLSSVWNHLKVADPAAGIERLVIKFDLSTLITAPVWLVKPCGPGGVGGLGNAISQLVDSGGGILAAMWVWALWISVCCSQLLPAVLPWRFFCTEGSDEWKTAWSLEKWS